MVHLGCVPYAAKTQHLLTLSVSRHCLLACRAAWSITRASSIYKTPVENPAVPLHHPTTRCYQSEQSQIYRKYHCGGEPATNNSSRLSTCATEGAGIQMIANRAGMSLTVGTHD